jgi:hypothetical protein
MSPSFSDSKSAHRSEPSTPIRSSSSRKYLLEVSIDSTHARQRRALASILFGLFLPKGVDLHDTMENFGRTSYKNMEPPAGIEPATC